MRFAHWVPYVSDPPCPLESAILQALDYYEGFRSHGATHIDARDAAAHYLRRKLPGVLDAEDAAITLRDALAECDT